MRTYKSERYRVLPDHKRPGTWIVVDYKYVKYYLLDTFWSLTEIFEQSFMNDGERSYRWPTKSQAIAFVELLEETV
jgi:hypothetical protein